VRIHKILGNNGAIVLTNGGRESVAVGKGLTFGLHTGDSIDEKLIDRMYIPQETGIAAKFAEFAEKLPLEYLTVYDDIVQLVKTELAGYVAEKIMISLIDHISFAIERHRSGINISTGLNSVIQQAYPKEYELGCKALQIIDKKLNVTLPQEEAVFIAFHLVNAGSVPMAKIKQTHSRFVAAVIILVEEKLAININRTSKIYQKFVEYLQEFVISVTGNKTPPEDHNFQPSQQKNPDIMICVDQIAELTGRTFNYSLNEKAKLCLFMHIHQIYANSSSTKKERLSRGL